MGLRNYISTIGRVGVRLPLRAVQKIDLFCPGLGPKEFYCTRPNGVLRADVAEVEVDCSIEALDLVLDEQADLDVTVLKELVHLLADNSPVICIHFPAHFDEPPLSVIDVLCRCGASNELPQRR